MSVSMLAAHGLTEATDPRYVRPADWPALPATAANTVDILVGVLPGDSNHAAVNISVSSGNYTVDWGDGSTPDVAASGSTAEHVYSFADPDLPAAVAEGWKPALVRIAPETPGATITLIALGARHSAISHANATNPWIDVRVNAPACTALTTASVIPSARMRCCEIVAVDNAKMTSGASQFANARNLEKIILPAGYGSAMTTLLSWAVNCSNLIECDLPAGFGASATTLGANTASGAFAGCEKMRRWVLPAGFGQNASSCAGVFGNNFLLEEIVAPAPFLPEATTIAEMYFSTFCLKRAPLPAGGPALTTASNVFGSSGIEEVNFPDGWGPNVTNMTSLLLNTTQMRKVTFGTGFAAECLTAGTSATTGAFRSCGADELIFPAGAFAKCTNFSGFMNGWRGRRVVFGAGFGALGTTWTSAFSSMPSCTDLPLPAGAGAAATTAVNIFQTGRFSRIANFACPVSFSVASMQLGAAELNAIYAALPVVVGQTITVSGNPGVSGHNPAIATAKGWTVAA